MSHEFNIVEAHNKTLSLVENFHHCLYAFSIEEDGMDNTQKQLIARRAINLLFQMNFKPLCEFGDKQVEKDLKNMLNKETKNEE